MRASEEYFEKLCRMRKNVYMDGKLVGRDDPQLTQAINVMSKTFDLVEDPKFKGLITAKSHLTGEEINRFTHINRSTEDLLTKQKMIRKACHLTGGCIQRCMGCDAINALLSDNLRTGSEFRHRISQKVSEILRILPEKRPHSSCSPN